MSTQVRTAVVGVVPLERLKQVALVAAILLAAVVSTLAIATVSLWLVALYVLLLYGTFLAVTLVLARRELLSGGRVNWVEAFIRCSVYILVAMSILTEMVIHVIAPIIGIIITWGSYQIGGEGAAVLVGTVLALCFGLFHLSLYLDRRRMELELR